MNYWVISDTHFGHEKMVEKSYRPANFSDETMGNLIDMVGVDDILIHLGDFSVGNNRNWAVTFMTEILENCRSSILVRGNHDKQTTGWYINMGWGMVVDNFSMTIYGASILFSHRPFKDDRYDLNIHGHLHDDKHRLADPDVLFNRHKNQFLFSLEREGYRPATLRSIVEGSGILKSKTEEK